MPLSEFLRLAIEKLEASKKKSCTTDHSVSGCRTENNLVEVVWEDGPTYHSLSPTTPSLRDATTLGNSTTECLGGVDSLLDDLSPVVPSGEVDLSQNYSVDDGVQDYFSEISGVKANENKRSSCNEAPRYLDNDQDAFRFCKGRAMYSWPPRQGQKSRLSGISSINRQDVMFGNGGQGQDVVSDSSSMKMGSRNSLKAANLPISGGISSLEVKQTDPACRCSHPVKSMLIQGLTSKPQLPVKEKDFAYRKTVEPVFASSSVGSGNSGDRVSFEETRNLKRKLCEIESECHSDDIQKPTAARGDTGAKKTRTAQVHNLSERRRRDRINEKMRALQQLIPNCNKADKASMLDDAIQYLKNLQHQVQTMSMGAGLCVPQMMFAPGSQHMYPAPIPHYQPMGVGMGMSYPLFPVHANFQGNPAPNVPIHGQLYPGFHSSVPRPPSTPFNGAHHTSLRIPTTSLNLNSEDPIKSTNSNNAEGSSQINRANNQ